MSIARRFLLSLVALVGAGILLELGLPVFVSGPVAEFAARMQSIPIIHLISLVLWALLLMCTLGVLLYAVLAKGLGPQCVHPQGRQEVEVSIEALLSVARLAATAEDVMVERAFGRVRGSEQERVDIQLELIALTNVGLADLGERVRERVQGACCFLLGAEDVRVRVRFLPSKTVMISKEA